MIFCAWDYHSGLIFRRWSQCDVKSPFFSVFFSSFFLFFEAAVHKQRDAVHDLSALNFHGFEAFRNVILTHSQ